MADSAVRLQISAQARDQLAWIADFYRLRNRAAATRIAADFRRAFSLLRDLPHAGKAMGRGDLRERVTPRYGYRIIYKTSGSVVLIIAIVHGRQDWP